MDFVLGMKGGDIKLLWNNERGSKKFGNEGNDLIWNSQIILR